MRRKKSKDIKKLVDEASVTANVTGYLSNIKQSCAHEGRDKPWYLDKEARIKTSLKEDLRKLVKMVLLKEVEDDEDGDLTDLLKAPPESYSSKLRDLRPEDADDDWGDEDEDDDPAPGSESAEEKELTPREMIRKMRQDRIGPAWQGDTTPQWAKEPVKKRLRKGEEIDPEIEDLPPEYAARSMFKKDQEDRSTAKGPRLRSGFERISSRNKPPKSVSRMVEPFKNLLQYVGENAAENEELRSHPLYALSAFLEKNPGVLDDRNFLLSFFSPSFPDTLVMAAEKEFRSKGKDLKTTGGFEQGRDRIFKLFQGGIDPKIIAAFVKYYVSNKRDVIEGNRSEVSVRASTGRRGVSGDVVGAAAKQYSGPDGGAERVAVDYGNFDIDEGDEDDEDDTPFNPVLAGSDIDGIVDPSSEESDDDPSSEESDDIKEKDSSLKLLMSRIGLDNYEGAEDDVFQKKAENKKMKELIQKGMSKIPTGRITDENIGKVFSPSEIRYILGRVSRSGKFLRPAFESILKITKDLYGMDADMSDLVHLYQKGLQRTESGQKRLITPDAAKKYFDFIKTPEQEKLYTILYNQTDPSKIMNRTVSGEWKRRGSQSQDQFETEESLATKFIRDFLGEKERKIVGRAEKKREAEDWKEIRDEREKKRKGKLRLSPEQTKDAERREQSRNKERFGDVAKYPQLDPKRKGLIQHPPTDLEDRLSRISQRIERYKDPDSNISPIDIKKRLPKLVAQQKRLEKMIQSQRAAGEKALSIGGTPSRSTDEPKISEPSKKEKFKQRNVARAGKETEAQANSMYQQLMLLKKQYGLGANTSAEDIINKYKDKIKESKLPMSLESLKKVISEDFKDMTTKISIFEMLVGPDSGDDEIDPETKDIEWHKSKPAKQKDFYPKLESVMYAIRRKK